MIFNAQSKKDKSYRKSMRVISIKKSFFNDKNNKPANL